MQVESSPLEPLRASLPPVFPRVKVRELTGGAIAAQTCANADSEGKGPAGSFILGRRVCYKRDEFVEWLEQRLGSRIMGKVGSATKGRA